MREGEEGGTWGGGQGRQGRAGRAGLGWVGSGHFADRNPRHDVYQTDSSRHDATPMTLRFWFIHDTDTCHYTGLKLGRKSETGREKRVTPEFGERKEEKILPPKFRAL
jgi:hypothetical protein